MVRHWYVDRQTEKPSQRNTQRDGVTTHGSVPTQVRLPPECSNDREWHRYSSNPLQLRRSVPECETSGIGGLTKIQVNFSLHV